MRFLGNVIKSLKQTKITVRWKQKTNAFMHHEIQNKSGGVAKFKCKDKPWAWRHGCKKENEVKL